MFWMRRSDRRPDAPRHRAATPRTERLEERVALSITAFTASASPRFLRPLNPRNQPTSVTRQHVQPVTLFGEVANTAGTPSVSFGVVDSEGRDQPGGSLTLYPLGPNRYFFTQTIGLSSLRPPTGREYTVVFTASDADGAVTRTAPVTVPFVGFFRPTRVR